MANSKEGSFRAGGFPLLRSSFSELSWSMATKDSKTCQTCGRIIEWRKKWERNWAEVRYCSGKCRRSKAGAQGELLEREIISLLEQRAAGVSICPSEVARKVGGDDEKFWRSLMEPTRQAARRLVARDQVVITQKGQVVDPSTAKGPIRIRLS